MGGEQRPLERQVPRQSVLASRAILTGTDNLKIVPSLTANLPTTREAAGGGEQVTL